MNTIPNSPTSMIEIHPAVIGLSGGNKQLWLRRNHPHVLDYYHKYGPDATMQRFNMRQYTLEAFLIPRTINYQSMTKADRAIMKADIATEAVREVKHRLNDIETQLEELVPMAQIAYGFLSAVARVMPAIELKEAREKEDPLSFVNFARKSGK